MGAFRYAWKRLGMVFRRLSGISKQRETVDPVGSVSQTGIVVCRGGGAGGAFASPPQECRSAHRQPRKPDDPGTILGFRVVLVKKSP